MVTKECVVGGRKPNDDIAQILNKAIKIYQVYVVCDFKTVMQTYRANNAKWVCYSDLYP